MDKPHLAVLYVDDEVSLLDIGKLFLERFGTISVDTAPSAREALEKLQSGSYDAIISDYQMPGMDGIELLQEVRLNFGKLPFILFTGRGREEVVIQAINYGADFYLQKGGEPKSQFAELDHKIRQAVSRRQAEHALIESERTSRALLEATTDAVALINIDSTVLAANETFLKRISQHSNLIIGRNLHDFVIPVLARDRVARLEEVIVTKKPVRFEDQRDEQFLENSFYPIFDDTGEVIRIALYSRDITDKKRTKQDLHAAYEKIAADEEELREKYDQIAASEHSLQENYRILLRKEQDLKESKHRLADIINFAPDATFAIDTQGVVVAWNHAIEKYTGIPASEILGQGDYAYAIPFYGIRSPILLNLIDASDDELKDRYTEIHREGGILTAETMVHLPHGEERIVWGKACLLYDEHHTPVGAIESMRDITEWRRIEDELRKSNEQIRGIAETIPGVVFQFFAKDSGETGLYYVSNRVFEILGISGDLSIFLPAFIAGVAEEDRKAFIASIDLAVRNESRWAFEGRFIKPSGERIYIRGMSAPVKGHDELLFSGVILDISREKEAREFLQSEKNFSQLLLDTSPAFIVAIRSDGTTLMMNTLLLDALGYSAEEVKGKDYLNTFVPKEDRSELAKTFNKITQDLSITLNENRVISKNGQIYLVEWRGRPLKGISGNLDFFIGVGIDITHRKEAEDQLRKNEERYRSFS